MLLPTDLPEGWNRFVEASWESQPRVFPSLLRAPASLSRVLFGAAVCAVRGGVPPELRFVANASRQSRPPLPLRSDGGFEAYLHRAAAETQSRDVTFILNEAQASSVSLFECSLSFLSALFARLGVPLETDTVIFATRSHVSSLGVHRDPQSNFVFLAEGEKTFLLWPRHAVSGEPEVAPADAMPALRSSARTIQLRPGDALYVPTGWYHCALQDGFSVHLSITLSTVPAEVTQRFLRRELGPLLRNSPDPSEGVTFVASPGDTMFTKVPGSITRPLRRGLMRMRTAEETIRTAFVRSQSAGGFWRAPAERPHRALKPSDWVVAKRSNLRVMRAGHDVLVGACGHVYRCPAHPLLIRLLETLARAEAMQVRDLLRSSTGAASVGEEAVLLESRWVLLFLENLCAAGWLKTIESKRVRRAARKS